MEALFSKVRTQQNSKLENQQQAATALLAVETTLDEQGGSRTPAAYFAVLFALLSGQTTGQANAELRAALIYLLAAVFPELPTAVLRHKYEPIVTTLGEVFAADKEAAPVMRATIGCLDAVLFAQDAPTWTQPLARQAFQALLMSSVDARPKVRRRAQEAVEHLLAHPPTGASRHPAAATTAEFCIRVLNECAKSDTQSTVHGLALAKLTVGAWPAASLPRLCDLLLHMPKLNNTYLTVAALEVFEGLFGLHQPELAETRLPEILQSILQLKPHVHDAQLMPVWLRVVSLGFSAYAAANPDACAEALPQLFTLIFPNLETDRPAILAASSIALSELVQSCISPDLAVKHMAAIDKVVMLANTGLGYRYHIAWTGILTILETLFTRLGRCGLPVMQATLEALDRLRMEPEFDCKDELDQTIGAAVRHIGVERVLAVLPLNLDDQRRVAEGGRAWLLPVLADHGANTELRYFVETLIPLGDQLAQKAATFREASREIEWKVYTTLTHQIWRLLPGFLTLPVDAPQYFTGALVERVIGVMQNEPELLPAMCTGLQLLVEKYQTFLNISRESAPSTHDNLTIDGCPAYDLTPSLVEQSMQVIAEQAKPLLSALFNVYGATAVESRGYILKVIQVYLTITTPTDVNSTYRSVHQLLLKVLDNPQAAAAANLPDAGTLLDLAIGMLAQLDLDSLRALFSVILTWLARDNEPTLQKKAHQILRRAANYPPGEQLWQEGFDDICQQLIAASGGISSAAKKDRLLALKELVKRLPSHQFNHVPTLLSETILCTKEVNERTRDLAYDLLVTMGYRMKEGGTVTMTASDGTSTVAQASLTEYFTMTAAGLAGATPHMISASIAALSRLLFEFKDDISQETIDQLLETVHVFIVSGSREVVKSALGLVKVAVITLEASRFQHHLEHLMNALLRWSNDHKGHFKVKVRHIVERLIRKFGYDAVETLMPEKDRKLVVNIKKRRQRAKRRREAEMEGGQAEHDDAEQSAARASQPSKMSAYEDALYGSESDLADSDDDEVERKRPAAARTTSGNAKTQRGKSWIKEDEDTPLDFLGSQVVSHVTSSAPSKRQQRPAQDRLARLARQFATSADGRIMIDEGADQANASAAQSGMARGHDDDSDDGDNDGNGGNGDNYYLESKQSREAYTRVGQRIKFNNRGTNAEAFADDSDADEGEKGHTAGGRGKAGKAADARRAPSAGGSTARPLIGQAYRSKKASGDVKRAGRPDPYAYIPLNPLTLKKR
ncbi:NUC173 domain-containing protein [Syncephalis pseudoplumigaleata]|uniref:NUC173 domain-containing protein n=1 Tax=Syncephalis pseudoplumigaleata TaxID=1712513 RepID=A0A4P9Z0A4_9FUNG|nr:NUC173 domain-containing protein [Syncephalis pseudoplumigaleata]|eukprot:RKP25877.1 NUC173 domain-containing protein [Syncephalis pseudoplumigaleata]